MLTLIGLALSAALVVLGAMALFRGQGSSKADQEAPAGSAPYWDEDCACCDAECGEADDENVCLICGH